MTVQNQSGSAPATHRLSTVRDILDKTTRFFQERGIASARLDAELILAEALGMDRLRLYLNFDRPFQAKELEKAREMVRRRATNEPMAYIVGRREFASRPFKVSPAVLIPRPETELLVELVEFELRKRFVEDADTLSVLEFGIGSGAIAITLALSLPGTRIVATEISADAAAVARENAETYGVLDRVDIRVQPDFSELDSKFHCVVANPPYVDPATRLSLAEDVVKFEPSHALFAENRGLQWYEFLCEHALALLAPGGFLAVEIGMGQEKEIGEIAAERGWKLARSVRDYAGITRILMFEP